MERDRPDVMYLSTTDYVQHKHAPGTPAANAFYAMMDGYLAQLDALGATIALTADHGMNAKTDAARPPAASSTCRTCSTRWLGAGAGARDPADHRPLRRPPRRARLVRDRLPAGRRGRGRRCGKRIAALPGIEVVLDRAPRRAARFELPPDRIGDLVVVSERLTVIGTSAGAPRPLGPRRAAALARRHLRAAGAAAAQPPAAGVAADAAPAQLRRLRPRAEPGHLKWPSANGFS